MTDNIAGSFWSDINTDPFVDTYLAAKDQIEKQVQQDLIEFRDCASRETTPLYHRCLIQSLTLRKTQQLYDNNWQAPKQLVNVGSITDKICEPTQIWLDKIDFTLQNGVISFREDPFAGRFDVRAIHASDGQNVDTEVTLWLNDADYDEGYLNDMWGAAIGLTAPSSEAYRTLLCTVYDAMMSGTARRHVEQVVGLLNGGTYAVEDATVVESAEDSRGSFLATAKHIYRTVKNGSPLVSVGAHVKVGDPLFDTVTFHGPTADISTEQLPAVTLPRALLDPSIGNELTFANREVPLICTKDRVEFEISGQPEAVNRFWTLFNKGTNSSFSEHLAGQIMINPFRFLAQNVLKYNILLCILRSPETPAQLSGIDQNRLLYQIVPPHEAILFARQ